MANIITAPESGIYFDGNTAGVSNIPTLTGDASGVAIQYDGYAGVEINSSATGVNYLDRFSVEGANGRLFGVTDEVTGTVFSVNDAAGLPIVEVESTSSHDKITIGEYGTNALVVSGDKVGIGIDDPSAPLDIESSQNVVAEFRSTDNRGAIIVADDDTSIFLVAEGSKASLGLNSSLNAGNLNITSSGEVGIGTTSPSAKLELAGTYGNTKLDGHFIGFTRASANYLWANATGGDLRFTVNGNAIGSPSMIINTSGNVGIGTTSPAGKLDIEDSQTQSGSSATPTIKSTATTTATSTQSTATYKIQNYLNLTGTGGSFQNSTHQQVMTTVSSTGTGTNLKNHMSRVHTSGSGQISNVAHYNIHAELDGNGTITNWMGYAVAHGSLSSFTNTGHTITNTYGLYIGDITSGTQTNTPYGVYQLNTDMRNYFGGNVGIGTTIPDAKLAVAGIVDGDFTALRLMNQKTYGSGTGTNEKVRFVMGISESGKAFSTREGFAIDVGIINEADSSDTIVNFGVRDGGTLGTYQTVNGHNKSVDFAGGVTANGNIVTTTASQIIASRKFSALNTSGVMLTDSGASNGLSIANGGNATFSHGLTVSGNMTGPSLSLSGLSAESSERTALVINNSYEVGTRELGTNAFNSTAYLPLTGDTVTGVLTLSQNNNIPLRITGSNSNYIAMSIANTGSGNAGVYYDAINGDLAGSDYGFIGQEDAGYMSYAIGASSPAPYHVFTGGNVGVGTTSPDKLLHLEKSSSTSGEELLRLENPNTDGQLTKIGFKTSGLTQPQTQIFGGNDNSGQGGQGGNSGAGKFKVTISNPSGTHQEVIYAQNDSSATNKFTSLSAGGSEIIRLRGDGNVGIGTTGPSTKLHVLTSNEGARTTYADVAIEAVDAQLDLTSSSSGSWGSAINFVEGASASANTDIWSIARQTTGGSGDSSLRFNFGTSNQHDNDSKITFTSSGDVTVSGDLTVNGTISGQLTKKISGDGSATTFTVTHSFGTPHVMTQLLDYGDDGTGATYEVVQATVKRNSDNAIDVLFGVAPTSSEDYLVLITKMPAIS